MDTQSADPIAVIGAGPAGLATALAFLAVGKDVRIYERYETSRAAGNILNLWPPAIKALDRIGVDVEDIGAPCATTFRNAKDRIRATVNIRPEIVEEYGGGFIGMLRPDLYARLRDALPEGVVVPQKELVGITDKGSHVEVSFADGTDIRTPLVVGADGLHSSVRKLVFGETPIRDHRLHVIGGYSFDLPPEVDPRKAVIRHSRTVQGSYTGLRSHGRDGAEWWFVEAVDPAAPVPEDLHAYCIELSKEFPSDLQELIRRTDPSYVIRWPIRDRGKPPAVWSRGRVVLAGDAVHATSPYSAYGAGMSIVDGYFLGQVFARVALSDDAAVRTALETYNELRVAHTSDQVELAYTLGRTFHHTPAIVRPLRDFMLDHTGLLQKQVGDKSPAEISAQIDVMGQDLLHPAAT